MLGSKLVVRWWGDGRNPYYNISERLPFVFAKHKSNENILPQFLFLCFLSPRYFDSFRMCKKLKNCDNHQSIILSLEESCCTVWDLHLLFCFLINLPWIFYAYLNAKQHKLAKDFYKYWLHLMDSVVRLLIGGLKYCVHLGQFPVKSINLKVLQTSMF